MEVNGNVINISTENTTGITLTIPPQVDKLNGVIRINDKCFDIDGNDKVIFHKNKSGFEFAFSENKGVILKELVLLILLLILCELSVSSKWNIVTSSTISKHHLQMAFTGVHM